MNKKTLSNSKMDPISKTLKKRDLMQSLIKIVPCNEQGAIFLGSIAHVHYYNSQCNHSQLLTILLSSYNFHSSFHPSNVRRMTLGERYPNSYLFWTWTALNDSLSTSYEI